MELFVWYRQNPRSQISKQSNQLQPGVDALFGRIQSENAIV